MARSVFLSLKPQRIGSPLLLPLISILANAQMRDRNRWNLSRRGME
jgi:hypothetical protein